ncbi:putative ankyrin repeat protein [Chloropicon roscoffensis]|uniref:Ankyrin repeat protein n=1 Tax=Chloropicon roscoffensis TaxID=1461544 RepID=A0AAX4PJJ9_9CHLO
MAGGAGEPSTKRAKVDEAKDEEEVVCFRLPPELWQKIVDENVQQNDLVAFAMTCRFFRDTTKDLGKKMKTNLCQYGNNIYSWEIGKVASHTLGWFQWVCDTFEILPGFERRSWERLKGAVYEGDLVNCAASQGSVEILGWLVEEKGCELNKDSGLWAVRGGSVKVLEDLRGKGYEFNEETCREAAEEGHLEALKFLRGLDPPCPWDWGACSGAAGDGRLEVLKWARAQEPPCPWDEWTCASAAFGGHLDVLKWARSQDPPCPWTDWTCSEAAKEGHLHILKWARAQDPPCPWSKSHCSWEASENDHQHIVKWIDQQEDESDAEDWEYSDNDDVW